MEGILLSDLKWETDLVEHCIKNGPKRKKGKTFLFFLDMCLPQLITSLSCTSKQIAGTTEWLRIARTDPNGNAKKFREQYV